MTLSQLAKNILGISLDEVKIANNTVRDLGSCTGNQVIDLALANVFTATLTGPGTWSIANPPPAGKCGSFAIQLTNPGTNITWAVPPKWEGGVAPTMTVAGKDWLYMTTIDGGTTWDATAIQDVK